MSENDFTTVQDNARRYADDGYAVIRLKSGTKKPVNAEWQNSDGDDPATFQNGENIGALMGTKSGNRIDIDCDDQTFADAAAACIPTGDVFGRPGKPHSHRIIRLKDADEPLRRRMYIDPIDEKLLGELRGDGHQTMLPGSTHPSGEFVVWESYGESTGYTPEQLDRQAGIAATVATLVRHYGDWSGRHHDLSAAFAGMLARDDKYSADKAEQIVRLISRMTNDHEPDDRIRVVRDTYAKFENDEKVTGYTAFADIVGSKAATAIRQWLNITDASVGADLNDAGNADRLIRRHGANIRYSKEIDWLTWDGRRWAADDVGQVYELAKDAARSFPDEAKGLTDDDKRSKLLKFAVQSLNIGRQLAMVESAKTDARVRIRVDDLDRDPLLINVENGTINLRTGGLQPHDRADFITKMAPVRFDPRATSPLWNGLLERVLPDPDVRAFVQRYVGYSLTGRANEKAIVIFYGGTDTGKTTVVETLQMLFGEDYAKVAPESTVTVKRGGNDGISNDVARLRGARLVTVSETTEGAHLNAARLKAMAGRNKQTARFLHKEYFEFTPTHKLLIETNHRPIVADTDDAIWNRIKLVEFCIKIPVEDQIKGFADLLRAELPGILNWAVAGCLDWQARGGLDEPDVVKAATQGYRNAMNPIDDFFNERCVFAADAVTTHSTLYAAYATWAESTGIRHPLGKRPFTAQVTALDGVTNTKGTGNVSIFRGIGLTPVAEAVPFRKQTNPFEPRAAAD